MVDPDGLKSEKEKDEDGDPEIEAGMLFGILLLIERAVITVILESSEYITKALKLWFLRGSPNRSFHEQNTESHCCHKYNLTIFDVWCCKTEIELV